jgi:hypothetical protein
MSLSSTKYTPLNNQRGIALLYLVILFIFLGVLASAGAKKLGSVVNQKKVTDSKVELERNSKIITAWAVKNNKLPTTLADVFGASAPQDAWGKPLGYTCDVNLTAAATGGLCGRTATTGQDVAFVLISGGDDISITSTASITSGVLTGVLTDADLSRSVTLMELQAQAGCAGSTQGSLKILNNELPRACKGITYPAKIFTDGGVPPVSVVSPIPGLPSGITNSSDGSFSGTTTVAAGAYPVTVTATDSQTPTANTLQRKYFLNVTTCY